MKKKFIINLQNVCYFKIEKNNKFIKKNVTIEEIEKEVN